MSSLSANICPLCNKRYDYVDHTPFLLPCNHTICLVHTLNNRICQLCLKIESIKQMNEERDMAKEDEIDESVDSESLDSLESYQSSSLESVVEKESKIENSDQMEISAEPNDPSIIDKVIYIKQNDRYYDRDDVVNGKGEILYASGAVYIGELYHSHAHGEGILKYHDGTVYEGNFDMMKKSGEGTMKWTNGDVFSGYFKNDTYNGNGTMIFVTGDEYTGMFKNGNIQGIGILNQKNGIVYRGEFIKNEKNGSATEIDEFGQYDGFFKDGCRHGSGIFTYNIDKSSELNEIFVYNGEYINGQKEGKCLIIYTNGNEFDGYFYNNEINGEGIMKYFDGSIYTGNFLDGKYHGYGEYISQFNMYFL